MGANVGWGDLPLWGLVAIGVLGAIQLGLQVYALLDLFKTPAERLLTEKRSPPEGSPRRRYRSSTWSSSAMRSTWPAPTGFGMSSWTVTRTRPRRTRRGGGWART